MFGQTWKRKFYYISPLFIASLWLKEPPLLRAPECPNWSKLWISCSWLKGFNWDNNLAVSCFYESENCNQKRQKTVFNHPDLICGQGIILHLVTKAFSRELINAQVHILAPLHRQAVPLGQISQWEGRSQSLITE